MIVLVHDFSERAWWNRLAKGDWIDIVHIIAYQDIVTGQESGATYVLQKLSTTDLFFSYVYCH